MFRALGLTVFLTSVSLSAAEDSGTLRQPLLGKAPPELSAREHDWLVGPALSLEELRGRVVWLQFNFSEACTSSRRSLVRWEEEFKGAGPVIIEVSGGKFFGMEDSRQRLASCKIRHSVLWDRDNLNAKAYAINGWPSAYLIGPDGKVFWQGNPEALQSRKDDETAFRKELKRQLILANFVSN